jgi:hypothetical protein
MPHFNNIYNLTNKYNIIKILYSDLGLYIDILLCIISIRVFLFYVVASG